MFIGSGTPQQANKFQKKYKELKDAKIYVDQELKLYKAFKMNRLGCLSFVKGICGITRALSKGFIQDKTQGDYLQLGGSWLLEDKQVLFEHIEKFPGMIYN